MGHLDGGKGIWETIPWRQKKILDAQNNIYDGRTAHQTSLDHVFVIFGDFEIFRIFCHPSPPATFFYEPKNAQKLGSKKVSQNRHFLG